MIYMNCKNFLAYPLHSNNQAQRVYWQTCQTPCISASMWESSVPRIRSWSPCSCTEAVHNRQNASNAWTFDWLSNRPIKWTLHSQGTNTHPAHGKLVVSDLQLGDLSTLQYNIIIAPKLTHTLSPPLSELLQAKILSWSLRILLKSLKYADIYASQKHPKATTINNLDDAHDPHHYPQQRK